jgi:hypothetical protein
MTALPVATDPVRDTLATFSAGNHGTMCYIRPCFCGYMGHSRAFIVTCPCTCTCTQTLCLRIHHLTMSGQHIACSSVPVQNIEDSCRQTRLSEQLSEPECECIYVSIYLSI